MVYQIFYLSLLSLVLAQDVNNGIYGYINSNVTFQRASPQNEKLPQQYADTKKEGELSSYYEGPGHTICPNTHYPEILSKLLDILFGILNYSSDLHKINDVLLLLKKKIVTSPMPQEKEMLNVKLDLIEKLLQNVATPYVSPGTNMNIGAKTTIIFKHELPSINQPRCRDEFEHILRAAYNSYVGLAQFPNCQTNDGHTHETHIPHEYRDFEVIYNDIHPPHINNDQLLNKPIDPFYNFFPTHTSPKIPQQNNPSSLFEIPSNDALNTWSFTNKYPEMVNNPNINQPVPQSELNTLLLNQNSSKGFIENTIKWPDVVNNNASGASKGNEFNNNLMSYLYEQLLNEKRKENVKVPSNIPHSEFAGSTLPDMPNKFIPQQYPGNQAYHQNILNSLAQQNHLNGDASPQVYEENFINSPNLNKNSPLNSENLASIVTDTPTPPSPINPFTEDILKSNLNDNSKGKVDQPISAIDYSVLLSQLGLIPPPKSFKDYGPYYKPADLSGMFPNQPYNVENGMYVMQKNQELYSSGNNVLNQGQNSIQTNINEVQNSGNVNPHGSEAQETIIDHYKIPIQYDKVTVNHDIIPFILEYISSQKNLQNPNQILNNGNYGNLVNTNGLPLDSDRYVGMSNPAKLANKTGIVELTYVLKTPKPLIYKPVYYVKYRVPYTTFMDKYKNLVNKPLLRLQPAKLHQELLTTLNASEVSLDLKGYKKDDLLKIVFDSGALVDAKLINGKDNNLNEQVGIVQSLNSNLSPEDILELTNLSLKAASNKPSVELKGMNVDPTVTAENTVVPEKAKGPSALETGKNPVPVLPNPYLNYVQPNPYLFGNPLSLQNGLYRNPRLLVGGPHLNNPRLVGK